MALSTISAPGLDTFTDVDVALQADGSFMVTWEGQTRGQLDTDPNAVLSQGIYVQRFSADGQPMTDPVLLASETGQSFFVTDRRTSVATSSSGGTLVAYLTAPGTIVNSNQIVIEMLGADLAASSTPVTISASGLDTFTRVDVASQADGSFVVIWEGQTRGQLGTDPSAILSEGVYVQRFAADGQSITGPVLLTSETGQSFDYTERSASIATSPDGGTLVAYLSAPNSTASPNQIVVEMLNSNLAANSPPVTISASGLDTFSDLDVALQPDGSFVVTWEGQTRGQLGTDPDAILVDGVYAQRFAADGQPITDAVLLNSEAGQSFDETERRSSVATSPTGETLLAYLSAPSSTASPNQIIIEKLYPNLAPACFAAGTRIATERGAVAVEQLRPGDIVLTVSGGRQIIQWIGYRDVACRRVVDPQRVWPIRIAPHAFGHGRPQRPLLLSPDHSVFVEDVLIPVKFLVNDTTVVQLKVDSITYYHVELPRHGILLAEGLPVESYLETGGRSAFANAGAVTQLQPDFAPDQARVAMVWQSFSCAPLLGDGSQIARARTKLQLQAEMLGASAGKRRSRAKTG